MSTDHDAAAPWLETLTPGAQLLHLPSGKVGTYAAFWTPGTYADPEGHLLQAHVLRLDSGDTFLADPENFSVLSGAEGEFYSRCTTELRKVLATAIGIARVLADTKTLDMQRVVLLIRSALATQLRELERAL